MPTAFEAIIRELTKPIHCQLPRPWMTEMKDPAQADVFIVGMNPRTAYPDTIKHHRFVNALFNRNGEGCRALHDEVTGGKPSPTRRNIDGLTARLNERGIRNVIETDVVCFATPLSKDLRKADIADGVERGRKIFRFLLCKIAPRVIIVHGARATRRFARAVKEVGNCTAADCTLQEFARVVDVKGLRVPGSPDEICDVRTDRHLIIPIPSLAPPAWNRWAAWAPGYLDQVAHRVGEHLAT